MVPPPMMGCRSSNAFQSAAAGLLVVSAVVIFFAPFFFQGKHIVPFQMESGSVTGIPNGGDALAMAHSGHWADASPILIHYPNASLVSRALHRFELPTWNPYVACGQPGLANGQMYPFSPFLWPFYLFPNPWTYTLGLVIGTLWGALGVFLWLGRLELDRWQCALGAALLVINPWTVRLIVYSSVWAAWWFGWLLWSWEVLQKPGERRWWLPAVMIAGMVYCGHPEIALLLAGASAVYAAVAWFARPGGEREATFWLKAGGAVVLAGALTGIHWLPVVSRSAEALPYKFLIPQLSSLWHRHWADLFTPRSGLYTGPVLMGLAVLGVWAALRNRRLWGAFAVLVLALVLLFDPLPGHGIYDLMTLGGLVPSFYARGLFWFSLAPFAAAGAGLLAGGVLRRSPWKAALLGAGVVFYGSFFCWRGVSVSGSIDHPGPEWLVFNGVVLVILAVCATMARPRARAWLAGIGLCLVILDPFVLFRGYIQNRNAYAFIRSLSEPHMSYFNREKPLRDGPPAVVRLKHLLKGTHGRFCASPLSRAGGAQCLAPDLAELWQARDVRVVDVMLSRRYDVLHESFLKDRRGWDFASLNFPSASPSQLGLLGVRYYGRARGANSGNVAWTPVPDPLPRAFLAHRIVPAKDEEQSFLLWNALFKARRLRREVIVEGWKGAGSLGVPREGDRIDWLEDGLDTVRLRVASATGGLLVLLDSYADGWRASIDGAPARIYPANLAFRAVAVPPGEHVVVFRYAPKSVKDGLVLSGTGWVAVLVLLVLPGTRERRKGGRDDA